MSAQRNSTAQKSRKYLSNQIAHGLPEPKANQLIARITASRGHNIFEVERPLTREDEEKDVPPPRFVLCRLPTKFKELVWLRGGAIVIIEQDNASGSKGKVQWAITDVLLESQITHLKQRKECKNDND